MFYIQLLLWGGGAGIFFKGRDRKKSLNCEEVKNEQLSDYFSAG